MRLRGHAGWLVLLWAVACSVYDEGLLTVGAGAAGSGGGSAASGGSGGSAASGGGGTGSGSGGTGGSAANAGAGTGGGGSGSGGGGAAGKGGSGGAEAGTPGSPDGGDGGHGGQSPVLDHEIIDDMEDQNPIVSNTDARNGRWITDNDGSGTTTPPGGSTTLLIAELTGADAREGSSYGLHIRAEGFQQGVWGAYVGVHFKSPDSTPYDASAYCGIRFWAKRGADVVTVPDQLEIRIPDIYTIPAGGHCTATEGAGGAAGDLCYDHHAKIVYPTDEWTEYTIYFSEAMQGNWVGYAQSPLDGLDVSAITSLEFFLGRPEVYDFWLDDLAFINKPEGGECP